MNTNREGDWYAEYEGVPLYDLLLAAGMDEATTTGVAVFSPDGFSYVYDLNSGGESYPVKGVYPQSAFHYDPEADKANGGWCNYSAPSCRGRQNGDTIAVAGGLKLILAYLRDGAELVPGYLDDQNRLSTDSEGPFRTVVPQLIPGPPDQLSTAANQDVIWPYDKDADHNAGFSERAVVAIRIEPLPEGMSDFNWFEGGWNLADKARLVIYGAINPHLYRVWGKVVDEKGKPMDDVQLSFGLGSLGQVGQATSGSWGRFSEGLPEGDYVAVPTKEGYVFEPESIAFQLTECGYEMKFTAYPAQAQ